MVLLQWTRKFPGNISHTFHALPFPVRVLVPYIHVPFRVHVSRVPYPALLWTETDSFAATFSLFPFSVASLLVNPCLYRALPVFSCPFLSLSFVRPPKIVAKLSLWRQILANILDYLSRFTKFANFSIDQVPFVLLDSGSL